MAVAYIAASGVATWYTNPLAYALGAGADFVFAGSGSNADDAAATRAIVGAMADLGSNNWAPGYRVCTAFGQVNPTSGEQDFEVTATGDVWGIAIGSFSGVDATTPAGTPATGSGSSTAPAVSVTSVPTGGLAVCVITWAGTAATLSAGTDETIVAQHTEDNRAIAIVLKTGTGTVAFAPTLSGSSDWGIIGLSLLPASAPSGPTIDTEPVAQTAIAAGPYADTTVQFTVAATTSGGTLLYQWQEDDGGGFANISNGGIYGGATTATLTLTGVSGTQDGYAYRCNVTDDNDTTATDGTSDLTVLAGDVMTPTSGTSDASGNPASEPVVTSDYLAGDDDLLRVTATAGGVIIGTHVISKNAP